MLLKMKWVFYKCMFLGFFCGTWCQDIVFPDNNQLSRTKNTSSTKTPRIPATVTQCPDNMELYSENNATEICDCSPTFLYYVPTDTCHAAYRQGPCPPQNYFVLPENEQVALCERNPCLEDGLVRFNETCYPLKAPGGPCSTGNILGVNETTFQIECVPLDIVPFIIIDAPKRPCPSGSRRNALGTCKRAI